MKYYQGQFKPKNPQKYSGKNVSNIIYRSGLELSFLFWLDKNDQVIGWSYEEVLIPYVCPTDGKAHRYFVDFKVSFANGKTILVEIKPKSQSKQPRPKNKPTKRYITEVMTWAKNEAKWKAAEQFALDRKWEFFVYTEDTLRKLGIKILTELK